MYSHACSSLKCYLLYQTFYCVYPLSHMIMSTSIMCSPYYVFSLMTHHVFTLLCVPLMTHHVFTVLSSPNDPIMCSPYYMFPLTTHHVFTLLCVPPYDPIMCSLYCVPPNDPIMCSPYYVFPLMTPSCVHCIMCSP